MTKGVRERWMVRLSVPRVSVDGGGLPSRRRMLVLQMN